MASFTLNPFLAAAFGKSTEGKAALKEAADSALAAAQDFAPVDEGDYLEGLHVEETDTGYRLVAGDFKSGWIEFGTEGSGGHGATPAFSPLRKGCESVGLKLEAKRGGSST